MNEFLYHEVELDREYDYVEQAILTCCYVCGDRLEWDMSLTYSEYLDRPVFIGYAHSCGINFTLFFDEKKEVYRITWN